MKPDFIRSISKYFLALPSLLFCFSALAQAPAKDDNPSLTRTVPPPPNAASLGKYGDIPVSNYTGVPNISIPLYEAKSGNLSLPVSLSYHAGGIKVEEMASWVGLGWSLNAGGVITRTIRGVADDFMSGYGNYKDVIDYLNDPSRSLADKNSLLNLIAEGKADTEPDIYFFNFNGRAGKFVLGEDDISAYVIPQEKILIKHARDEFGKIIRWTITTPDGASYTFGKTADGSRNGVELNETYSVCEDKNNPAPEPTPNPKTLVQSWYLVEMQSPYGDLITFDYVDYSYSFRTFSNETDYYPLTGSDFGEPECNMRVRFCFSRNRISGKRLRRINFRHGKIEFDTKATYRADMCGDQALEFIRVYEGANTTPEKSFRFSYSYFKPANVGLPTEPTTGCSAFDVTASDAGAKYRLKLLSVAEVGSDNTEKPPHTFAYNEAYHLPPRIDYPVGESAASYSQDHWGYYNGAVNNHPFGFPTLIPSFQYDPGNGTIVNVEAAERTTNDLYVDVYTLTRIKYPTGGYSEFEFEPNTVTSDQLPENVGTNPGVSKNKVLCMVSQASESGKTALSDAFTINSELTVNGVKGAYVTFSWIETAPPGEGNCTNTEPAADRYLLTDPESSIGPQNYPYGHEAFLPNGTYYLKLKKKGTEYVNCYSSFCFSLAWKEYSDGGTGTEPGNVNVGGIRIKRIKHHDDMDASRDLVQEFKYHKFSDPSVTSGILSNYPFRNSPVYGGYNFYERYVKPIMTATGCINKFVNCNFLIKESYSSFPLSTTQGAVAGYQNVTIEYGAGGANGKSEFTYTTAADHMDEIIPAFPYPPPCSFDWRRGLLVKETNYKKVGTDNFIPVTEHSNEYRFTESSSDPLFVTLKGLKIGIAGFSQLNTCNWSPGKTNTFAIKEYNTKTEWMVLRSKTSKTFNSDDPSKWVEVTERFEYQPNHMQLSKKTLTTSTDEYVEVFTYPEDYTGIAANADANSVAVKKLQEQFIVTPIEKYSYRQTPDGTKEIVSGALETFRENPAIPSRIVPEATWTLESSAVLPGEGAGSFVPSLVSSGNITWDARYKQRSKYFFDENRNLKQSQKTSDLVVGYLWGYNNSFPIAEVLNVQNNRYQTTVTNQSEGSIGLTIGGPPGVSVTKNITVDYTGPVTLKIGVPGSQTFTTYAQYDGSLGSGSIPLTTGNGCGFNVVTLAAMASPGTYTITITLTTTASNISSLGACGEIGYPKNETVATDHGIIEFLYQGFEDHPAGSPGIAEGAGAHTGEKYHDGTSLTGSPNYLVSFTRPNSRDYIIEYWYRDINNKWIFVRKPYTTDSMMLLESKVIDNIRIYPKDSMMTSYTYHPLNGVTSSIGEGGKVVYYIYDPLGRLAMVKNTDGEIEKAYTYKYKDQ